MSKYIKLTDAIERLNELYHGYEVEEWLKHLPTIEVSEDCVSKRYLLAEIDDLADEFSEVDENGSSVAPNRAEGKWIDCDSDSNIYDDIRCSICGRSFTVDAYRKDDIGFTITDLKFCPNCGAKMKGADDDN